MTTLEQVTTFKLRTDTYSTSVGDFEYHSHAVNFLMETGYLPKADQAEEMVKYGEISRSEKAAELIKHTVTMATATELIQALRAYMKQCGLKDVGEYDFTVAPSIKYGDHPDLIPQKYYHLIAYAIEGSNEGYYVHVGVIGRGDESRKGLATYMDFGFAKLYDVDLAFKMAREAQRFLTAAAWN